MEKTTDDFDRFIDESLSINSALDLERVYNLLGLDKEDIPDKDALEDVLNKKLKIEE